MKNELATAEAVIAAVERERRRLGNELHDVICQSLAATTLLLERIARAVHASKPVAPEALSQLQQSLEQVIDRSRQLSRLYNPVALEGAGLIKALAELAAETPNAEFICDRVVFMKEEREALALYRIAQEAVANAVKHARASSLQLVLESSDRTITLLVRDNGAGFVPPADLGLVSGLGMMRARAESVRGSLEVLSGPGQGTLVTCRLPIG